MTDRIKGTHSQSEIRIVLFTARIYQPMTAMNKMKTKTACVQMVGLQTTLDQPNDSPTNPLPIKCPHCGFPDIDFVAKPYLLAKGFWVPTEIAPAMRGNFLVRERVRRILELAVPGACTFYPTAEVRSRKPTPWCLAVPKQKLKAFYPPPSRPLCRKCGAPQRGDLDAAKSWKKMRKFDSGGIDVFKTLAWGTWLIWEGGRPVRKDCRRDLYFSVRLEQLLTEARVRADLVRFGLFRSVEPSAKDAAWVDEKLTLLGEHGLINAPKRAGTKPTTATRTWFKHFLKRNASNPAHPENFTALESRRKLVLPQDYKDFIVSIGARTFKNVNGLEETATSVLPPRKLDFKTFDAERWRAWKARMQKWTA